MHYRDETVDVKTAGWGVFNNVFLLIQANLANWMHIVHLSLLEDLKFKLALFLATLEFWPENVSTDISRHIFQLADVC